MTYDLSGNRTGWEDISGKATRHSYNALDNFASAINNSNKVLNYAEYHDGIIQGLRHGSLHTEYSYDADRNLTGLKTMLGDEVLADDHYLYDHNGNRTERRQPGGATRYTYDDLNRLTKVEYPSHTEQLYYDRAGNRSRRVSGGTVEDYRYDPAGHLTEYTKGGQTTTFTYDKAGDLTADDKARYTYDLFNRTEKVETFDGHVQINHYDAEGLRSGIEEDGRLVQFIFRDQEVVTELEKDKGMTRYIRGYDLIASDVDSARTYYHYASDELGSITHVVAGEEILDRYEYDAWGNLTRCEETVENRFKFNGQQYDPISQQYYLRARYYNPVIGRFTQEDTYRGDGLNLYAYCQNNPVYYVDPSGHVRQCVKDAYDRIRKENPGMSAQDAYNLALKETGKDRIPNDAAQNTEQNRPRKPEAEGPDNSNKTLVTGEDWNEYFREQYGYENVNWDTAFSSPNEIVDMPSIITRMNPDGLNEYFNRIGMETTPLGEGSLAGRNYEDGGGYDVHFNLSGLIPRSSAANKLSETRADTPQLAAGSFISDKYGSAYVQYHPGNAHHGEGRTIKFLQETHSIIQELETEHKDFV